MLLVGCPQAPHLYACVGAAARQTCPKTLRHISEWFDSDARLARSIAGDRRSDGIDWRVVEGRFGASWMVIRFDLRVAGKEGNNVGTQAHRGTPENRIDG